MCKEQTGIGVVIGLGLSSPSPASSAESVKVLQTHPQALEELRSQKPQFAKTWHVITAYIHDVITVVGICFLNISSSGNPQCFLLPPGVVCVHI